jgi:glycosyltransferase involved in cell wall biosynthesis
VNPPGRVVVYLDADAVGGAELSTLALVDQLALEGADVVVLHHGLPPDVLAGRVAIATPRPRVGPLGLLGLLDGVRLAIRLRRLRPHAFHASLTWQGSCRVGLLAARLARVPRRTAELHLAVPGVGEASPGIVGALGRPDAVVAVSHALAPVARAWFRLGPDVVHVIGNTVEVDAIQAAAPVPRAGLGVAASAFLVVAVARLSEQKGLDVLLRALPEVEHVDLAVAGDGPDRAALAELAASLGVDARVRFLGRRADVAALLAAADAFVLPSRREGQPLALLEAMAAGRPIVATAVPGVDELVEDGATALLVPPDDPAALAGALCRLRDDPSLRLSLGRAAAAAARVRSTPPHAARVAAVVLGAVTASRPGQVG